ncbi:MAG: flagellar hook-associated protein FlgL [Burkholderiales bacterium]|nr:flagellar hook-associated protein FlgL [Burkholderiales bacterium]
MRIGTRWMHDQSVQVLQEQQADLVRNQQRISTGRRLLAPSDDPIASAQAVRSSQAIALTQQYLHNQDAARSRLQMIDGTLASIGDTYQQIREHLLAAGNAAYSDADRNAIAVRLQSLYQQLLGQANAQDEAGHYLFAGYGERNPPYAEASGGAVYSGDQGSRALQVSASRQMQVTENGESLFGRLPEGNGVFIAELAPGNSGGAVISTGTVGDPAALTGHAYRIVFHTGGAGITYDVLDLTAAATLSTGNAYTSGATITVDGMQASVSGTPADGDSMTLSPSANRNVFGLLADAIARIDAAVGGPAARAALTVALGNALTAVERAMERAGSARSLAGSGLAELDALSAHAGAQELQYTQDLAGARDLDYSAAVSEFARRQQSLQAAQQSYAAIAKLSLFNFL